MEWVEYLECFDIKEITYCDFSAWYGTLLGSLIAIAGIVIAFFFFSRQIKQSSKHSELLNKISEINTKLDDYKKDHNKIAYGVFFNYLYDIRIILKDSPESNVPVPCSLILPCTAIPFSSNVACLSPAEISASDVTFHLPSSARTALPLSPISASERGKCSRRPTVRPDHRGLREWVTHSCCSV